MSFQPIEYLAQNEHWKGEDGRTVQVIWQGSLLQVRVRKLPDRTVPRGMRQCCLGMSDASRWNLIRVVSRMQWDTSGSIWFHTYTYPDDIDWSKKEYLTMHRSILQRNLEADQGRKIPGLWRVEWKPRKSGRYVGRISPHVHVITFNDREYTWERTNRAWASAISWGGYVDTSVEPCTNAERMGIYIAKYVAKDDFPLLGYDVKPSAPVGRPWGKFRPKLLPLADRKEWFVHPSSLTRFVMAEARGKASCWALGYNDSFSVVGDDAGRLGVLFDRLVLDSDQHPE